MKKLVKSSLTVALLALPFAGFAQESAPQSPPRLISVTGEGEVTASPDFATIRLGVREEADTAEAAMQAAAEKMSQIFSGLEEAGIAPEDMQTSQLRLGPVYSYPERSQPQLEGYEAQNTLAIRLRDIDTMGETLDTLTSLGANDIQDIGFDIEDRAPLSDEAMQAAVVDARRKAELLAEAAGVTLGDVESINIGGRSGPVPVVAVGRMAMAEDSSAKTPIAAGELTISSTVQITYGIE
ncbi:SIMPL domain-containing protein [Paracoccaceae bacterium GXU_MW_L88]